MGVLKRLADSLYNINDSETVLGLLGIGMGIPAAVNTIQAYNDGHYIAAAGGVMLIVSALVLIFEPYFERRKLYKNTQTKEYKRD